MHQRALLVLALIILLVNKFNCEYNLDELTAYVNKSISDALSYTLPTDNSAFFTPEPSSKIYNYGTFDFIIVGAGSAGSVLANRLTELRKFKVLLLEAGGEDNTFSQILAYSNYLWFSDLNWGYYTTPQTTMCQGANRKECPYPRGKVVGGSSTINAAIYSRGNRLDFDAWESLGNRGWSYADVLPYFKKAEHADFSVDIDRYYHGFNGPLHTNITPDTPELTSTLLQGFKEIGAKQLDYNGRNELGMSRVQFNLDFNKRASTARAYLRPAQYRSNLNVSLGSLVTKVVIDTNQQRYRATEVRFIKNGKRYKASARKEIILSAGAINTPQILMLSGIGPQEELKKHNISLIKDLPVGKHLIEHPIYHGIYIRTNRTYYNMTLREELARWLRADRPLVAGLYGQVVGFLDFEGDSRPEVEYYLVSPPGALGDTARFLNLNAEYTRTLENTVNENSDCVFFLILLHSNSNGTVTLKSKSARDFPVIDLRQLAFQEDIDNLYKASQWVLKLQNTTIFKKFGAEMYVISAPSCDEVYNKFTREWWKCAIQAWSYTIFHPAGTTKMGPNPADSVVGPNLKVHGFSNLRVVDAGVMPIHVTGHTNAVTIMIAEKNSDTIKRDNQFTN